MFASIGDDVLALFKELSIDRKSLNKTVPNSVKRAFKRKVSNWQSQGIVKGYFKFKLDNLNKYTYANILDLCIYAIYAMCEKEIFEYSKELFVTVANDCYDQAKDEHPNPPVTIPDILTWAYIYKWLKVLNIPFEEYLQSLTLTAHDEMFSKCIQAINGDKILTWEELEKLLNRQSNRILNINEDKFSGTLDDMSRRTGNKAYIEPFPNARALFIAEMDEATTRMCASLNGQIFNTKDTNVFRRYSDSQKNIVEYEVEGLVEGINLPPIDDNFHWCRSTIIYQVDDKEDEKPEKQEKIKSFDIDNQYILKEALENGTILDEINKEKQAKHCDEDENFDEERSYIYGDIDDAIKLYNKYRGTGLVKTLVNGSIREYVITPDIVGFYQNNKDNERYESDCLMIIYSKTGSHLYAGEKNEGYNKINRK